MLAPGARLGPYEIQSAIGSGGMGEVYRARDTRLNRIVAIKVLLPQLAEAPEFRARFDREARAISKLSHPNICALYDIGEAGGANTPEGLHVSYLVMELVEGETLASRLESGPLAVGQAVAYGAQIADALDKAHRAGIIHGDLKPGNIMVTKAGVKLLDFGLAAQVPPPLGAGWSEGDTGTVPVEAGGSVLGTLSYLAPEQLEGKAADARTDIFACGAVVFEMVTGRKAFDGETQAGVIAAVMRQVPPALSDLQPVHPALDHLVAVCLAKDPDDRWQSAGDLARQLHWVAGAPGASDAAPRARSSAWLWKAAAGALLAVTLALAAAMWMRPPAGPAAVVRSSLVLPSGLRFPGARTIGGAGRFALSPDGRQMAFVGIDEHGNQMLWVRPLDSMVAKPIDGTDGASSPFWSPDSSRIAFFTPGQLKTVSAAGGAPMLLASPAFDSTGDWNTDDVILFTPTPTSPVHRVPASGGEPSPVTVLDASSGDVLHRNPSFLPDGRHFLYVAVAARDGGTTGPRALYVGSLDSGEAHRVLIERGSTARYAQGHILLVRDNRLVAQPFDVGRLTLTGEPKAVAEQVAFVGSGSAAFSVSQSGILAYQPSDSGSLLVWFDRQGRQLGVLGEPAEYGDVELSPDGRRAIVSVLDPAPNTRDLWVFDIERGVRTRFTLDPGDDVTPVFSPDGSEVLFASNRRGHFDLYRKAVDGVEGEAMVFGDLSEKYPTSWLHDGRLALYWSFDADGAGLSLLPLAGEQGPRRFLDNLANAGRFSPDGRWVAYHSAESGRPEVYVVPYPEASRRLQVSSVGGTLPRWRRDSKEIVYAGRDNRLMAVSVSVDRERLVAEAPRALFEARPVGPRSFFAVSPDGERFLVNTLRGDGLSSSITMVQNWSAALIP